MLVGHAVRTPHPCPAPAPLTAMYHLTLRPPPAPQCSCWSATRASPTSAPRTRWCGAAHMQSMHAWIEDAGGRMQRQLVAGGRGGAREAARSTLLPQAHQEQGGARHSSRHRQPQRLMRVACSGLLPLSRRSRGCCAASPSLPDHRSLPAPPPLPPCQAAPSHHLYMARTPPRQTAPRPRP